MKNPVEITILWFDYMFGVGEAKSKDGKTIFLNNYHINTHGEFISFDANETMIANVELKDSSLYATDIYTK